MNKVHEMVKNDGCQSVRHALIKLEKDRKTVDRFKYIYYMKHVNAHKLLQVRTKTANIELLRYRTGWHVSKILKTYVVQIDENVCKI